MTKWIRTTPSLRLRLLAVTAVAACGLAVVAAAGAATPEQVSFPADWDGHQVCPTFTITFYGHLDISGTVWSDAQGNAVKGIFHRKGWEVNTNDVTGKSFTVKHEDTVVVDFVAGTLKRTGASQVGTLPGQGIGMHESGLSIEDFDGNVLRVSGPHDNPDIAFCEALA